VFLFAGTHWLASHDQVTYISTARHSRMIKVLIVDDDPGTRETFRTVLRLEGFTPFVASTGQAGIELSLSSVFDVILVDLRLSDFSGLDVVRQLRSEGLQTPIVVYTAFPGFDSCFEAGQLGATEYIAGPLFGDEIVDAVRRCRSPVRAASESIRCPASQSTHLPRLKSPADDRIRAIVHMIEANGEYSAAVLAERASVSESRLRHLFKQVVGMSLSRFIRHRRLRTAASLLTKTHDPVADIARRLGLADLRKSFRVQFGVSPATYRTRYHVRGRGAHVMPKPSSSSPDDTSGSV
jgi:YesN/AraC family two-component response regulator